jgi:hypothetical protein
VLSRTCGPCRCPERGVRERGERLDADPVDGAHAGPACVVAPGAAADLALAVGPVGGTHAGDPGVGQRDRAQLARGAGGCGGQGGGAGHHALLAATDVPHGGLVARGEPGEQPRGGGRLQVRQGVEGDRPVRVGEHHGLGDAGRVAAHVHAGPLQQLAVRAEPCGRVVVAAGDDHAGPGPGELQQGPPPGGEGLYRRDGAVEDVARDEDHVHPFLPHDLDDVVHPGLVGVGEVGAVETATEVPVGGVEQAHATTLGRGPDTTRQARPSPGRQASSPARRARRPRRPSRARTACPPPSAERCAGPRPPPPPGRGVPGRSGGAGGPSSRPGPGPSPRAAASAAWARSSASRRSARTTRRRFRLTMSRTRNTSATATAKMARNPTVPG